MCIGRLVDCVWMCNGRFDIAEEKISDLEDIKIIRSNN